MPESSCLGACGVLSSAGPWVAKGIAFRSWQEAAFRSPGRKDVGHRHASHPRHAARFCRARTGVRKDGTCQHGGVVAACDNMTPVHAQCRYNIK